MKRRKNTEPLWPFIHKVPPEICWKDLITSINETIKKEKIK